MKLIFSFPNLLRLRFPKVNNVILIIIFAHFIFTVAAGLTTPLFAVFVIQKIADASLVSIGILATIYWVGKGILQIPISLFLDKTDGERDDFYALIIGAAFGVLYPFALLGVSQVWHLYLLEIFAGAGTAALMAAYYSLFARHVDKGAEGFEWSLFSVGGLTISSAIGAAIGGVVADAFGFKILFLASGIINLAVVFSLFYLYLLLDGARPVSLPPFSPLPKNPTTKS